MESLPKAIDTVELSRVQTALFGPRFVSPLQEAHRFHAFMKRAMTGSAVAPIMAKLVPNEVFVKRSSEYKGRSRETGLLLVKIGSTRYSKPSLTLCRQGASCHES